MSSALAPILDTFRSASSLCPSIAVFSFFLLTSYLHVGMYPDTQFATMLSLDEKLGKHHCTQSTWPLLVLRVPPIISSRLEACILRAEQLVGRQLANERAYSEVIQSISSFSHV